jgi:DNA replication factor GINS
MVQEIYLLRLLKAIEEVTKGRLPNSLVERERQAFIEIRRILDELYVGLIVPAITGRAKIAPPHEVTNILLVFSSEMPQIIGDDLKPYGPFKRGEAASLPRRTAELILKHGLAKRVEIGGP